LSALPHIRIGIADDHPVVRLGLRACLAGEPDFAVVAEAANGREALDRVREGGLDVLLLDVAMPVLSGVDALAAIRARAPELPVLCSAAHRRATTPSR
jgi:two-component system, NarL family, invasion response regulator UvrY